MEVDTDIDSLRVMIVNAAGRNLNLNHPYEKIRPITNPFRDYEARYPEGREHVQAQNNDEAYDEVDGPMKRGAGLEGNPDVFNYFNDLNDKLLQRQKHLMHKITRESNEILNRMNGLRVSLHAIKNTELEGAGHDKFKENVNAVLDEYDDVDKATNAASAAAAAHDEHYTSAQTGERVMSERLDSVSMFGDNGLSDNSSLSDSEMSHSGRVRFAGSGSASMASLPSKDYSGYDIASVQSGKARNKGINDARIDDESGAPKKRKTFVEMLRSAAKAVRSSALCCDGVDTMR